MGNSCTRCWHNRISVIEHYLIIVFRKWGYFVASNPLWVIIGSLILAVVMSVGTLFIESETKTLELYAPKDSISYNNYRRYYESWKLYEDNIDAQNVYFTSKNNKDLKSQKNIFTVEYLSELLRIHHLITDLEVKYEGNTYTFYDLCRQYENGNCVIQSILSFYDFNQTKINNAFSGDINILYPSQFSPYSESIEFMVLLLGQNISVNNENHVTETPAFAVMYALDATLFGEDVVKMWEDKFLSFMGKLNSELFDITYQSSNSFNLELNRAVGSDVPSFIISFILIGVFASLILIRAIKRGKKDGICAYKIDSLRNRSQLSIMGIVSTICAIFGSFGVVGGYFGVKWNPVVAVSPFLLVGLGVDDMFVLLRAYELTDASKSIPDRIALTMERGGISILFTSITDLVAFCVGATSPFGCVSAFCLYCGVGVFLDFIFQITFFVGMMVYDSRPETCCICCQCGDHKNTKQANDIEMDHVTKEKELEIGGDVSVDVDIDVDDTNILLSYMINNEASSVLMKKLSDLILRSVLVKILILFLFIAYLIGATIGILQIHAYQDPIDLVPADSYLIKWFNVYETYFDQIGQRMEIVIDKPLDYSDNQVFQRLDSLVTTLQNDECFESEKYLTSSWIHSYRNYLEENYGNNTNSSLFYNVLYSQYLDSEHGEQYIDDIWNTIIIDHGGDVMDGMFNKQSIGSYSYQYIDESRIQIRVKTRGLSTESVAGCLDNYKSIMNEYDDLGVYYYLYITVIAESDLVTIQQTIRNLIYAMIAACIITMILIPYPTMTIFVMTTVGQILFGVLGYMSLWGLPINTTTMINVVMSVGFSVDNAAHFCHAFMNAPINYIPKKLSSKKERDTRVLFALNSVGMPILAGDMSTIVALLPLVGSNTEIFTAFWKCISLVMIFGAAHSVLYLPVILSFIGPVGIDDIINDDDVTKIENILKTQQNINQTKSKKNQDDKQNENETETKN